MNKRKVARNAPCPCESGKKYKNCCASKRFTWLVDDDGNFYRSVPMHPEVAEALKQRQRSFKKAFGREIEGDDPIIFEGISEKEVTQRMVDVMSKAGVNPAAIHAYMKTGLILTSENRSLLPDVDVAEWENAFYEYSALQGHKPAAVAVQKLRRAWSAPPREFDTAIIFLGRVISDHGIAKNVQADDEQNVYAHHDFVFFCLAKTLKSLRAIKLLLGDYFGEDGLALSRSVYENYLHISYVLRHPERINNFVALKFGLRSGLYKLDRSKGCIRDCTTNEIVGEHITVRRMAKESAFAEDLPIYDFLYQYLSDYSHPNMTSIGAYLDGDRFDVVGETKLPHALLYSLFPAVLILRFVGILGELDPRLGSDLSRYLSRAEKKLRAVFSHMATDEESRRTADLFTLRLARSPQGVFGDKVGA